MMKLARWLGWWVIFCTGSSAWAHEASEGQPIPEIALDPAIECWYHSRFPTLGALVSPPEDIVRSRLYFRCSLYPDYYFVDLTAEGGLFRGVAPQAEESCPRVHYYVEAVGRDFTSARTAERVVDVTSHTECQRRLPAAAWFPGDDPELFVGSTVAAPAMAPGFKSTGVAGFISATGAVAAGAAEGGTSAAAVAGIAAGGAAAVGGLLAAGGSSDPGTTTTTAVSPPSPTSTIPPTTTPAAKPVKACVELDPADGVVGVLEPLAIDGRCSEGGSDLFFRYDLGDGRVKEGQAFITAVWSQPGSFTLTLTVSRSPSSFDESPAIQDEDSISRRITVKPRAAPVTADFTVRNLDPDRCHAEFDGSASTGDVAEYRWELDVQNDFGQGVIRKNGRVVMHDWGRSCFRTNGLMTARLTVLGEDGSTAAVEKRVNVLSPSQLRIESASLASSLTSELLDAGEVRGRLVLSDGRAEIVTPGSPVAHRYRGRLGSNTVEAVLTSSRGGPVSWRFDFSGARHYVAGSLRLVSGVEVARDAYSVVVRFSGAPGERARFEYELR